MIARPTRALAAGLVAVVAAVACGKRGSPLPPLRPVSPRIGDLTAHRVDNHVEIRFTVPSVNADGSSPAAITGIELYRSSVLAGVPAPSAAQVMADPDNLRTEIQIGTGQGDRASAASESMPDPIPGAPVSFVDPVGPAEASAPVASWCGATGSCSPARSSRRWSYVATGVVGGRRGAPSAVVSVPLGSLPEAPERVSITHDETTVMASWQAGAAGQLFAVFGVVTTSDPPTLQRLTPEPIAAAAFSEPVELGRERCFAVRTVVVAGAATIEGSPSSVACVTPVDRYPPSAPASLRAIQEGATITLNWTSVDAPDLVGYVVLRGDGAGASMQSLMSEPIPGTVFRDATVQSGNTYTYSVYAVDNAPTPNASQQSDPQVVTVR